MLYIGQISLGIHHRNSVMASSGADGLFGEPGDELLLGDQSVLVRVQLLERLSRPDKTGIECVEDAELSALRTRRGHTWYISAKESARTPISNRSRLPRSDDNSCQETVDVRLPGKGNSNSHGARPVYLIITMINWIRTSRLSIKQKSLCHEIVRAHRPSRHAPRTPASGR